MYDIYIYNIETRAIYRNKLNKIQRKRTNKMGNSLGKIKMEIEMKLDYIKQHYKPHSVIFLTDSTSPPCQNGRLRRLIPATQQIREERNVKTFHILDLESAYAEKKKTYFLLRARNK